MSSSAVASSPSTLLLRLPSTHLSIFFTTLFSTSMNFVLIALSVVLPLVVLLLVVLVESKCRIVEISHLLGAAWASLAYPIDT